MTPEDKSILITEEGLIRAFTIWNKRYKENPDAFIQDNSYLDSPEEQASYLIEIIKEQKNAII